MKNSISKRIELLMKKLGHTKNSFSQAIGLTNNVTIGRIINENRKPSYDILEKIIQTFGNINANWMLTGKGSVFIDEQLSLQEPSVEYKKACKECKEKEKRMFTQEETIKAQQKTINTQSDYIELLKNSQNISIVKSEKKSANTTE